MTVVTTHRAVRDARTDGEVSVSVVRTFGQPAVRIKWYCGDQHAFTEDAIKAAITHLKTLKDMDVWLEVAARSSAHNPRVKLKGGRLHAEHSNRTVDYDDLRKAIRLALKDASRGL